MIRRAVSGDIPACLVMGRAFFDESGFAAETSFDPDSLRATLERLLVLPDGILLVADYGGDLVGMAAGIAYPHYFNAHQKAAQELFWWVRQEMRGGPAGVRLLRGLEDWAKRIGCVTLSMICLPAINSPAERVYQRSGYRPSERVYMKGL